MHFHRTAALAACLFRAVSSQTSTDCNPTEKSCSSDAGLSTSTYSVDFTAGASSDWNVTYGTVSYSSNGAAFTITKSGDAPTIETNFYVFFGIISVFLRAAPGTGIVSSAILESDDLDEVDWEWLGGSPDQVETNYFGKGNTTTYDRATYVNMADSQSAAHNYTIHWTSEAIVWYIDGSAVRTLAYADALGGRNYPQTPMRVKLGIWAGGDSSEPEGTIEWAGGLTNYSDGPFTMYVERVDITNFNPGESYTYGDETGDWTSIEIDGAASGSAGREDSGNSSSSSSAGGASTTVSSGLATGTGAANSTITSTASQTESATSSASSSVATVNTSAASGWPGASVTKYAAAIGGSAVVFLLLF